MTIGIVGVGPVGLAAVWQQRRSLILTLWVVVVESDEHRLAAAQSMGATGVINNKKGDAVNQ